MTPQTRDGPSGELRERIVDAYRRRGQDLFAFAYRLVDGPGAAEDVVHDAFVRLLDGRCHIDAGRGDLDMLLFGIVRNVAREHRRRESMTGRLLARAQREDKSSTQEVVAEDVLAVQAALRNLSDTDREVVVLSAYHGCTSAEIARALGTSAVVARVRLHRARARLRRALLDPCGSAAASRLEENNT
jgi:RNA polymerase sigma-70 factor (ECF subfamily)